MTPPNEPKSSLKPARWGLYCGFPWLLVAVQYFLILPRFHTLFQTWKVKVDPFSAALLRFSWWGLQHSRLVLLLTGGIGLASALLAVRFSQRSRSRGRNLLLGTLLTIPLLLFLMGFVVTTIWNRKLIQVLQN